MSGIDGLILYCVSNSSQSGVGTITLSNGDNLNSGNNGIWKVQKPGSRPGIFGLQNRISSGTPMVLTHSDQGIYTCNIPDGDENDFIFNIGLYPSDFNGTF